MSMDWALTANDTVNRPKPRIFNHDIQSPTGYRILWPMFEPYKLK